MADLVEGRLHTESTTATPEELVRIAEGYCIDFPTRPAELRPRPPGKEVVLVTGTTGNFGTDLLEKLLRDDSIGVVYALNRKGSRPMQRQQASFRDREYDETLLDSPKFRMVEGNLGVPGFDLEPEILDEIRNSVTWMIHNAWAVNFNFAISSFDVHLRALRYLVDIALSSPYIEAPKVQYISSITVFQSCELPAPVPETPMPPSSALGSGYGESKWVGEYMLLKLIEQRDLPVQIVRLAQICGDESGYWNTDEWFPCIVKSANLTQCLPDIDGDAAFMPNVPAAQVLIEMHTSPDIIMHLTHPRPARLRSLFASIGQQLDLPLVSWNDWLHALAKSGHQLASQRNRADYVDAIRKNPALILLGFFCTRKFRQPGDEMVHFIACETTKARAASPTLEYLPELEEDITAKWMAAWRAAGFLERES